MSDFREGIAKRLSNRIYVIVVKDPAGKLTLLADPGMDKPWCANSTSVMRNKKLADFHAAQCDGMACTWSEAFSLLMKENPLFEKQLYERLRTSARIPDPLPQDKQTGQILDKNGNPISNRNPSQQ